MKTRNQVIKDNPKYKSLINAVLNNIDEENIKDINEHGIDAGFGNFIHYSDTVKFFKRNRKQILNMAENLAGNLGEDMLDMIKNFKCLNKQFSKNEIAKAIYKYEGEDPVSILNAMAWFAAEEVCRMFED